MIYDILIIGAGPAGSMAAKTASELSVNVLLIERNKEIGYPVRCAEGINKFLFRDTGIKKDDSFIKQKIDGTKIYFYNEIYELNADQWKGYTIDRRIFDKYIAQQAEIAGARISVDTKAIGMKKMGGIWHVKVKQGANYKEIKTRIVIGADGFECNIGRYAGIRNGWKTNDFSKGYALEIFGLNTIENNVWHIAFGEEFFQGCAWLFPKGGKHANVGVAVSSKINAKKSLDFFILEYPNICNMIEKKYVTLETRGGGIPICGPKLTKETIANGIILVGDAAGMVDPITGEGISPSMISGSVAGETAALCIKKNNWGKKYLSKYQQKWKDKTYINSTLGENLDSLLQLKEQFYNAFMNRKIPTRVRRELINEILAQ